MIGLILGGLLYMIGYWIMMSIGIELRYEYGSGVSTMKAWRYTIWFFEFYLAGITAIMYGINCWTRLFDDEMLRIQSILSQLLIVSLVLFIGYTYISTQIAEFDPELWELPLMAAGYGLILISCIVYIIFYFLAKTQSDNDLLQCIMKNTICGLMITGSLLTAIGFWAEFNQYDPNYDHALNSWNTAYCLLLIGLCAYNGTDIRDSNPLQYSAVPKQDN